jgi:hypothetical protein
MPFPNIADLLRQDRKTGALPVGGVSGKNSELLLSVRGTFYAVSISENASPGMYAIDELTRFITAQINTSGGLSVGSDSTSVPPVLLTGIDFNQMDITSEMPCLNNVKVFYTFGQNFGQVQITGEVLLGSLGETQQHNRGFRLIRDFFWQHRVSVTRKPIAVSIASEGYFVYLKGLKIGQIDPNYHILPFAMFGTLLDINREDSNRINPRSTVITTGDIESASLISAIQASKPEELVLQRSFSDIPANPNIASTKSGLDVSRPGDNQVPTDVSQMDHAGKINAAEAVLFKKGLPADNPDVLTLKQLNATKAFLDVNGVRLQSQVQTPGLVVSTSQPLDNVVTQSKTELEAARAEVSERIVRAYNNQSDPEVRPFSTETAAALDKFGIDPTSALTSTERPSQWQTVSTSPLADSLRNAAFASGVSPDHPGPLNVNDEMLNIQYVHKDLERKGFIIPGNH